jgi:hypothetical protein
MDPGEFDNPARAARWLQERRTIVEDYLSREGVEHGGVEKTPRWQFIPYATVWFAKAPKKKGRGIWVISGDMPTDYMSAVDVDDARDAMRAFAARWERVGENLKEGREDPEVSVGKPGDKEEQRKLGALLQGRAKTLSEWADDDSLW